MKLPLNVVLFDEMFIPHSGLRSSWDTIGAKLHLITVGKCLIGPNLTYNPGFTFEGVTAPLRLLFTTQNYLHLFKPKLGPPIQTAFPCYSKPSKAINIFHRTTHLSTYRTYPANQIHPNNHLNQAPLNPFPSQMVANHLLSHYTFPKSFRAQIQN